MKKSQFRRDRESLIRTISRFDENRKVEDVTDSGKSGKHIKSHTVLLQVLLEEICGNFETDENRKRLLFNEIYKRLGEAQFLDSSIELDGLASHRHGLAKNFHQFVEQIQKQIPVASICPEISCSGEYYECQQDVYNVSQINRYNQTFDEIQIIARGGYGVVCKARHKVDDVIYAVKKVDFKYKNDPEYRKVLREAKSIAALRHPNVVSYNNAWIDINLPNTSNSRSPSTKSSSQGSSSHSDSSEEESGNSSYDLNTTIETNNVKHPDFNPDVENFSIDFEEDQSSEELFLEKESCLSRNRTLCNIQLSENTRKNTYINHTLIEEFKGQNSKETIVVKKENQHTDKQIMHTTNTTKIDTSLLLLSEAIWRKTNSNSQHEICDKENQYDENVITLTSDRFNRPLSSSNVNYSNLTPIVNKAFCSPTDLKLNDIPIMECKALLPKFSSTTWNLTNLNVKSTLYIQMEYCDCDLRYWLDQRSKKAELPFKLEVVDIFKQILCGVDHIHSKSIIHRDLKPKNVFFSEEYRVMKIGDFGLATLVECTSEDYGRNELLDNLSAGLGTVPYAAPEQRRKHKYDCKVDIYSLGIILIELLNNFQTKMEFSKAVEEMLKAKFPDDMVKNWPNHIELVTNLIRRNPKERPCAKEILELPILRNDKQKDVRECSSEMKKLLDDFKEKLSQKDSQIAYLKRLLEEKESEINHQKAELLMKNKEIENLTIRFCS